MESLRKRIRQGLLPLLKGIPGPPITSGLGFGVQGSEFREKNSLCTIFGGGGGEGYGQLGGPGIV